MSISLLHCRAVTGISAVLVTIEVHLSRGLPGLGIVGLAETAVKESRHRVKSAILNSDFEYPPSRIIVNMAPADVPKEGGGFDLAIALGILAASGQIPKKNLQQYEFFGELSLQGAVRGVTAILPSAIAVHAIGRQMVVPIDNAKEAVVVDGLTVYAVSHLKEIVNHLNQKEVMAPLDNMQGEEPLINSDCDMQDVMGQARAKRVLEIAACGQHHALMVGPPGAGKSMLAARMPGLLPPMTIQESIETAAIYSVSQLGFTAQVWRHRPCRSPHHTASSVALIGGGAKVKPGEVSLAHNGLLFLDEFPEFSRHVLEVLREPLESGVVHIARATRSVCYPARFQLIAAMNPCPCGYLNDDERTCRCTEEQVQRYRHKISGPLMDRIDLQIAMSRISADLLFESQSPTESSAHIQLRVSAARERQLQRCGKANGALNAAEVMQFCSVDKSSQQLITLAIQQFALSTRAVHRILKVSRSIADLAESECIEEGHVAEALGYRLDEE